MPKFQFQEQALLPSPADQCVAAATRTLSEMGSKPQVMASRISGSLGSRFKMRFVGGAVCPPKWLPIEVAVDVVDLGPQRQLVVTVAEKQGVGWMIGMGGKYRSHCYGTAVYVRDTIAAKLAAGG